MCLGYKNRKPCVSNFPKPDCFKILITLKYSVNLNRDMLGESDNMINFATTWFTKNDCSLLSRFCAANFFRSLMAVMKPKIAESEKNNLELVADPDLVVL